MTAYPTNEVLPPEVKTMGPMYGEADKPLIFDDNSVQHILDEDLMSIDDDAEKLMAELLTLPWDARCRVIQVHTAFINAYADFPLYMADDGYRLWFAALDTALIWELG